MPKDIKTSEEIKAEHNEKLFVNMFVKNMPGKLYRSYHVEAAMRGAYLRDVIIEALKEHRNTWPIQIDKFVCAEKEKP